VVDGPQLVDIYTRDVPPKQLPPDPGRLLYALRLANQAIEAEKERRLRPTGIAPAHYVVLVNLHARPGMTGAELARAIGVSPQNVTGLVRRLTAKGWIERRTNDRHAHVLELHLTDSGRRHLSVADAQVAALEAHVVDALGTVNAGALTAQLREVARSVTP
jgi:DNA-binding MarR family transcriptional regulator